MTDDGTNRRVERLREGTSGGLEVVFSGKNLTVVGFYVFVDFGHWGWTLDFYLGFEIWRFGKVLDYEKFRSGFLRL